MIVLASLLLSPPSSSYIISVRYSHFDPGFARAIIFDKTKKKVYMHNIFCQKSALLLTLLINSKKRIKTFDVKIKVTFCH